MQTPDKTDRTELDPVTHPHSEEWMSYLYGEIQGASKASLKSHLERCPQCQERVESWRNAMHGLANWKVDAPRTGLGAIEALPALKWALAALMVLGLGLGIGRFSAPALDLDAIRAAIEQPIRTELAAELKQQVRAELLADWQAALTAEPEALNTDARRQLRLGLNDWTARTVATSTSESQKLLLDLAESSRADRLQDQAAFLTLFDREKQERQVDYLSLRRAVETVAVVADDKFHRTESELGQFVSYAQLRSLWENSDETSTR